MKREPGTRHTLYSNQSLGGRPTVGLQILDLPIGVRIPASQPNFHLPHSPAETASQFRAASRLTIRRLTATFAVALFLATALPAQVVISQVYGGGGNSGATFKNDYVELFNRGSATVDINGWSIQYASAAGASWEATPLSGSIAPGKYYLVQQSPGAGGTVNLPTPDATGTIGMSATSGKVALVNQSNALTSASPLPNAAIVDFIGYGSGVSESEGGNPAPTLSNTFAALRAGAGCVDTDNNAADFTAGAPNPRNSATPQANCFIAPPVITNYSISQIQGTGNVSPHVNETVSTSGVVTALRSNGFYIQTPGDTSSPAYGDGNPASSEGLFVFTGSASPATAAIGNIVTVQGVVSEFVPASDPASPSVTELISPSITQSVPGGTLPAPVTITLANTSPTGGLFQLEPFEGMRVRVNTLTVVGPTQGFINEPNATSTSSGIFFGVTPGIARPFQEPGLGAPTPPPAGAPCCIPVFDNNPERIRVNTLGQRGATTPIDVTVGATVSNVVGVLDYAFRAYTILTDPAPAPIATGNVTATPAPDATQGELTIASFNMQRFFDATADPAIQDVVLTATAFNNRLNKASLAIRNVLRSPDMIGIEEMENLGALQAVADKVNADSGSRSPMYRAFLVEGNDIGGIDVGFLVKASRVSVIDVTQFGKDTTYIDPNTNRPAILNDRPPLLMRARVTAPGSDFALPITVIVNHLRSLSGIDDAADGPRVRAKRRAQAEYLANLIQARQAAGENVVSVGDYNAYSVNDGYVDVIGTIIGNPTPADQVTLASPDLVEPNLTDLVMLAPPDQQYSYSFDGNAETLDHILVSRGIMSRLSRFSTARNNADFPETFRNDASRPERISDHDMPVAYFTLPAPLPVQVNTSARPFILGTQLNIGTATVTNTTGQALGAPLQLVLSNLSPGISLINASGATLGGPSLTIPSALAPGESVTFNLLFSNPGFAPIEYTPKVYSAVE